MARYLIAHYVSGYHCGTVWKKEKGMLIKSMHRQGMGDLSKNEGI